MTTQEKLIAPKWLAFFGMFAAATLAMVAGILQYDIAYGGQPITPAQFGPRILEAPGLVWVDLQIALALCAMVGASAVAGESRWHRLGVVMMFAGFGGLAILMALLAHFARAAPDGMVMFAMCLGAGVPWSVAGFAAAAVVVWIERGQK